MSISFQCESCGSQFKVESDLAGRKGKCRKCGATIEVPRADQQQTPVEVMPAADAWPPPMPVADPPPVLGKVVKGEAVAVRSEPAPMNPEPLAAQVVTDGEVLPMAVALPAVRPAASGGSLVAERSLATIKTILDRGDYVGAMQALQQVGPDVGSHPGYYFLSGLAYTGLGNYPHALDNLTRAIECGVRNPTAYAAKGKAELALGQHVAAIESLDTALDLAGTDVPDYMADLAKAYDGANMRQDAAATWNALARINPSHPVLLEQKRAREEQVARKHSQDVQTAMLQMQKEQRASDTACWICIILRILLECM